MIPSVHDLTKQSGFIFEGTVQQTGAVASSKIEVSPKTAVVHVEKVLKGPGVLSGFAGKEITVALREHEGVHSKTRAVFFTNGFHYGEGLAVREVGHIDAAGAEVEREVHEAMKQADDDDLLQRVRAARLVVVGVVTKTAPYEHRQRAGTEHDPEWWECIIEVEAVLKGTVKPEKGKTAKTHITAFFAHSMDVAWYRAPKLNVGDSGIFVLHEGEIHGRPIPGPALIHPLDFRPMPEVEHVRALVRRVAQQ
jgi:hypothetical protein